jgi:hypothetical protein
MPNPSPTIPTLEGIRLAVARRQVEARSNAVKENLALLEQLAREVKQENSYGQ